MVFKVFWIGAPRWLYLPIYIAHGLGSGVLHPRLRRGLRERLGVGLGTAVLVLVLAGGALYTAGRHRLRLQRPDPWPRWFGFHEIFHSFTILAFVTHYVGVSMATYALR